MVKEKKDTTILVVDDEPEIRQLLCDYLADDEGYNIVVAEGGQEALDVLEKHAVDLVISDINMPGMRGFDLLKLVKDKYPLIKRVLITAYNVEDYLSLALTHDVGNIFVKSIPFNFNELSSVLRNLLTGDIFGPEKYFGPEAIREEFRITRGNKLDTEARKIIGSIPKVSKPKKLELVIFEIMTNAIFYGIRGESPVHKETWNHNFELTPEQAVIVTVLFDMEKYAISIVDTGGRLAKTDMLYWVNRQATHDEGGVPLGLYDSHGRGFFIAREYIDRIIVNIDKNKKTEVIIVNYYDNKYVGYKPLYINEL